jgi:hypothetical protein
LRYATHHSPIIPAQKKAKKLEVREHFRQTL